jgi:DNA-binding response OmpR family regulator
VDNRSLRSYQEGASRAGGIPSEDPGRARHALLDEGILRIGNLEIRPAEVQVLADGRRVGLTVREFQVLLVLVEREEHVVRRADIYGQVWGAEMKRRDRSVDVFVRKLRKKLARVAPGWAYIHTHFGVGYRFAAIRLDDGPAEESAILDGAKQAPSLARSAQPLLSASET